MVFYDTNFYEKELKDFSVKGSFLETDEFFDSENVYKETSYIAYYSDFTKNGLWTYSLGKTPAQIYKEEFYDSGILTAYRAYDSTGFKIIDLKVPKNYDSVYYKEKYANGNIKREGWVIINLADDYKFVGQDHSGEGCGNFDENGSETFFQYFDFMPISSWKEYHKNGKLKLDANFIKIKDNVTYSYLRHESFITKGYTIFYDGLWKKYDENGKLIQDFLYEKGEVEKVNKY